MERDADELAELLADLNEPQRQAVSHRDGPLLVLAGPGSGKTRVITRRAAYLVRSGIAPWQILAITFTNKAADEMKRRIAELGVGRGMWVYTFHALGVRLLREWGELGGVKPGFSIYDESDQLVVVKAALEVCKIGEHVLEARAALGKISAAKNSLLLPREFAREAERGDMYDRAFARVYDAYQQLLMQRNAVDFDDLIVRVAIVLNENPDVAERLAGRFRYILIDEYQDTNAAQYLIADRIGKHHRNICATGDPDQSIYSWRGADIRNILEFEKDYPDATVVRLEQNYRSHGHILRVADRLIAGNRKRKRKTLWTEAEDGAPVTVWRFKEGRDEAEQIADTIAAIRNEHERPWSDFAVFYRINAMSRGMEESLRARGIPYKIARGLEFYNRKEIKDALAYLRVLVNPADRVALTRIINTPPRGIGDRTVEKLETAADDAARPLFDVLRDAATLLPAKSADKVGQFVRLLDSLSPLAAGRVSEAVKGVLERTGLERSLREDADLEGEDRLANVQELVSAAVRYEEEIEEPSLADFLNRISLTSDQDAVDEESGKVLLMTLHAAKGLEFPVVFLIGMEQGMLPHERALRSGDGDLEEERRLCFVGITRAMRRLFLSRADERVIRGQWIPRPASQFFGEIDADDGSIVEQTFGAAARARISGFDRFGGGGRESPALRDYPAEWDEPADTIDATDAESQSGDLARPPLLRGKRFGDTHDEPIFSPDEPTGRRPAPASSDRFADWQPQMFVMHREYGVGQVEWIRAAAGNTRASIRFPGHGAKTFILEVAPVEKLERR